MGKCVEFGQSAAVVSWIFYLGRRLLDGLPPGTKSIPSGVLVDPSNGSWRDPRSTYPI